MTNLQKSKDKILGKIRNLTEAIKGSIYTSSRYCGKKNCACFKTKTPHKSLMLSFFYNGRTKLIPLKREWIKEVESKIKQYKELKNAIDELALINSELLKYKDSKEE
jgi:hypothetical protein